MYFRYIDKPYDLKLKCKVIQGVKKYLPVAGLNKYSKEWLVKNKDKIDYSEHWTHLEPYYDAQRKQYIAFDSCNVPGKLIR